MATYHMWKDKMVKSCTCKSYEFATERRAGNAADFGVYAFRFVL